MPQARDAFEEVKKAYQVQFEYRVYVLNTDLIRNRNLFFWGVLRVFGANQQMVVAFRPYAYL